MFKKTPKNNQSNTSETDSTTKSTVRSMQPSSKKLQLSKKHILTLLIVLGLIIVGVLIWKNANSSNKNKAACGDEQLSNASGVLKVENVDLLKPIAEETQKQANYDKDPNCLNIVTTYYIHSGDYTNAQAHLDKLEAVYKAEEGFSPKLGVQAKSLETLRLNISFLKEQNQRILDGHGVVPSPRAGE